MEKPLGALNLLGGSGEVRRHVCDNRNTACSAG